MKSACYFAGLFIVVMTASDFALSPAVAAGTNDHFADRKRQAAQQQLQMNRRPWGGPTTGTNWWSHSIERRHRVIVPGRTFFAPGYISPYSPYYPYYPYYQSPLYAPQVYWPRHHIHIERRLR